MNGVRLDRNKPARIASVRMKGVLPLLVFLGAVSACNLNETYKADLERRVPFDFGCPASSLVFTPLSTSGGGVTSYGVQGCGRQAVYVMNATGAWVLNSLR